MVFAVCFANRGTFPGSLFDKARKDISKALASEGHTPLMMPEGSTRHDAVGSPAEGRIFAKFLAAHRGEYDGVILSLPNFGDENGAVVALENAGAPVLVQAFPDEPGKMGVHERRGVFLLYELFRYYRGITLATISAKQPTANRIMPTFT